jgi:hypothetical protein
VRVPPSGDHGEGALWGSFFASGAPRVPGFAPRRLRR